MIRPVHIFVILLLLSLPLLAPSAMLLFVPPEYSEDGDIEQVTFSWIYDHHHYSLTIDANMTDLRMYEDLNVLRFGFDLLITFGYVTLNDPTLRSLATELMSMSSDMTSFERAEFILSFVQDVVAYQEDPFPEYYRYPLETLVSGVGDCEDSAILLVTLYRLCGYDAVFVSEFNHLGAAVRVDGVHYSDKYISRLPGSDVVYINAESTSNDGLGTYSYDAFIVFSGNPIFTFVFVVVYVLIIGFFSIMVVGGPVLPRRGPSSGTVSDSDRIRTKGSTKGPNRRSVKARRTIL